jgi:hypothetical protein
MVAKPSLTGEGGNAAGRDQRALPRRWEPPAAPPFALQQVHRVAAPRAVVACWGTFTSLRVS